jgi:hypothetical protein
MVNPDGRAQSTFQVQIKPFRDIAAKREVLKPGVIIPLRAVAGSSAPKLELRCLAADQKFVDATAAQQKQKKSSHRHGGGEAGRHEWTMQNSAVFLLSFGAFRFFRWRATSPGIWRKNSSLPTTFGRR